MYIIQILPSKNYWEKIGLNNAASSPLNPMKKLPYMNNSGSQLLQSLAKGFKECLVAITV